MENETYIMPPCKISPSSFSTSCSTPHDCESFQQASSMLHFQVMWKFQKSWGWTPGLCHSQSNSCFHVPSVAFICTIQFSLNFILFLVLILFPLNFHKIPKVSKFCPSLYVWCLSIFSYQKEQAYMLEIIDWYQSHLNRYDYLFSGLIRWMEHEEEKKRTMWCI